MSEQIQYVVKHMVVGAAVGRRLSCWVLQQQGDVAAALGVLADFEGRGTVITGMHQAKQIDPAHRLDRVRLRRTAPILVKAPSVKRNTRALRAAAPAVLDKSAGRIPLDKACCRAQPFPAHGIGAPVVNFYIHAFD